MSLVYFSVVSGDGTETATLQLIKEKTGVEITNLGEQSYGIYTYGIRFPNMETAQKVRCAYFDKEGTVFVDVDNHFLMLTTNSGTGYSNYVNDFFPVIIFDYKGTLCNVCYSDDTPWNKNMNSNNSGDLPYYQGNDVGKQDITLVPLRVYANNPLLQSNANVMSFIKNCYTNYERKFQRGLKFTDQNGNEFVTLGGYMLYKNK